MYIYLNVMLFLHLLTFNLNVSISTLFYTILVYGWKVEIEILTNMANALL